ncbi:MAG TPA: SRPBCC domain-containing protein [Thermoanaerobaculia bacterium]|nr:SRPBCC domain-containing protein [Thermoanaerobaculia bacterium]
MSNLLAPLSTSVFVPLDPREAFLHFTERISTWWPLSTYSVSTRRAKECGIEPGAGGEIWETSIDGERFVWGTIRRWDPPTSIIFSWHPGREASTAQEVEVRFSPEGDGTRVDLEHRGWEALGQEAGANRDGYANGWKYVLGECYVGTAPGERGAKRP